MAKRFILKRLLIGLLLVCGVFAYASFHTATAGGMDEITINEYCDTWEENMADYSDQDNCWSCQFFLLFFDAANKTAGQINNALSGPAGKVMIIGVALFVVFNTLIFFSDIGDAPDLMAFLTKVGGMILKAGIAYCFLKGGAAMAFDYIVNPVLTSATRLASQILDSTGTNAVNCTVASDVSSTMAAPMGAGVRSSLECMIKKIASGMARSQSIAQGLRCGAFFWFKIPFIEVYFPPNVIMWVVGMWLGCLFWIVSCFFPMAMLDVIFRIGLTVGMLPLFILAWVFPITASYAKTAWQIFLHSCMVFAITGIIVCMIVMMLESAWVAGESEQMAEFQLKMQASAYVEAWDMLFDGGFAEGLGRLGVVMCVAVWGLFVAPQADKLSGAFIGAEGFPKSCGIRAIRGTLFFIIDVIMAIITIISLGATTCLYGLKIAKHVTDSLEKVEEIRKRIEKVREIRERIHKVQNVANKGKRIATRAADAFQKGES